MRYADCNHDWKHWTFSYSSSYYFIRRSIVYEITLRTYLYLISFMLHCPGYYFWWHYIFILIRVICTPSINVCISVSIFVAWYLVYIMCVIYIPGILRSIYDATLRTCFILWSALFMFLFCFDNEIIRVQGAGEGDGGQPYWRTQRAVDIPRTLVAPLYGVPCRRKDQLARVASGKVPGLGRYLRNMFFSWFSSKV